MSSDVIILGNSNNKVSSTTHGESVGVSVGLMVGFLDGDLVGISVLRILLDY